jgi:hypothetical protein
VVKLTVSWAELTNVVSRALPFQFTTEVGTKPVPATLTMNGPAVPAVTFGGLNEVIVGAPFASGLMMNVIALEVPPGSGFTTVTWTEASGEATSAALIETSTSPVFRLNLVGRMVPSQNPSDDLMNPVPLMKSVKSALPAVMPSGEIVLIMGVGGGPVVLLLEQLFSAKVNRPTRTTAVHRERIKQILLKSIREARGRSGPGWEREENRNAIGICPAERAVELIASAARTVNSDSSGGRMVGSAASESKTRDEPDALRNGR